MTPKGIIGEMNNKAYRMKILIGVDLELMYFVF